MRIHGNKDLSIGDDDDNNDEVTAAVVAVVAVVRTQMSTISEKHRPK